MQDWSFEEIASLTSLAISATAAIVALYSVAVTKKTAQKDIEFRRLVLKGMLVFKLYHKRDRYMVSQNYDIITATFVNQSSITLYIDKIFLIGDSDILTTEEVRRDVKSGGIEEIQITRKNIRPDYRSKTRLWGEVHIWINNEKIVRDSDFIEIPEL